MKDRDLFEISLLWAEEMIDKYQIQDEFVNSMVKQLRKRFNDGNDCRGCHKQMDYLVEKLETGSFPWEKEIERAKIETSSLLNFLREVRKKNERE